MSRPLPHLRTATVAIRRRVPMLLVGQCVCIVVAWIAIALAPPLEGPMLLVPFRDGTARTITLAIDRGARLLGTGALPGSVIVIGRRDAIVPAMLAAGTIVVAAAPALCGDLPDTRLRSTR